MPYNIQYDPDTVQKLAERLYRRATFVLVFWPLIGLLGGGLAGRETAGNLGAVIGAIVGAYLGYLFGSMRSMNYKVKAQTVLWQKRLEEHMRSK